MESERDSTADQLKAADRAAAAPYLDYPDLARWYPIASGGWFAAVLLSAAHFGSHGVVAGLALLVLIGVQVAFLAWYRRRWSTWPRFDAEVPPEIQFVVRAYFVGLGVVLVLTTLTWLLVGPWVSAALVLVTVTALVTAYEDRYAVAADRVRERLS